MIKNIVIENFGPIKDELLNFNKGVNIIVGGNGCGKTQVISAIQYIYYGSKAIKESDVLRDESNIAKVTLVDYNNNSYSRVSAKRNEHKFYYTKNRSSSRGIRELFVRASSTSYPIFASDNFHQGLNIDLKSIRKLLNTTGILENTHEYLNRIINRIEDTYFDKHYKVSSSGEQYLLYILNFLSRSLVDETDVVVIDEFGAYLDEVARNAVFDIIINLQDELQFIITLSLYANEYFDKSINRIFLKNKDDEILSRIGGNYYFTPELLEISLNEEESQEVIKYVINDTVMLEENIETEFKEVKGNNPINSIISLVDQYVVAFLNAIPKKTGRVLWGIDDTRKIRGVALNYDNRDKLRREISNKLTQITPHLPFHNYSIEFHSIHDENYSVIKDLFIVEVFVKPTDSKDFYATAKDEIFIKTEGGKKKMKMQDLQIEIRNRSKS